MEHLDPLPEDDLLDVVIKLTEEVEYLKDQVADLKGALRKANARVAWRDQQLEDTEKNLVAFVWGTAVKRYTGRN
jgi:predicted  nucleic acid-binding Zn-ribbon protein